MRPLAFVTAVLRRWVGAAALGQCDADGADNAGAGAALAVELGPSRPLAIDMLKVCGQFSRIQWLTVDEPSLSHFCISFALLPLFGNILLCVLFALPVLT